MRTTITLEPDVARLVEEAMHRERRSMKEVLNRALRSALGGAGPSRTQPYRVDPHRARLLPGIDPAGFNRMIADLEDAEIEGRLRRHGP